MSTKLLRKGTWIIAAATLVAAALLGCAPNKPYYVECLEDEDGDCEPPFVNKPYIAEHTNYDLAFVEFTERGNLFNREQMEGVLDHVKNHAEDGATVVVFIHGWKHNANPKDPNLLDFDRALREAAALSTQRDRRLIIFYDLLIASTEACG